MATDSHRQIIDAAYATACESLLDGRYVHAEAILLDSLDRAPRAAQSVYLLGLVKLGQRQFGAARTTIDRAFALKPWVRELDAVSPDLDAAIDEAAEVLPDWSWPRYDRARRACFVPGITLANVSRLGILGNGTQFVQVGANDGVHGDPIREFVLKQAWRGLLVEPLPHVFDELVRNYDGIDGLKFANVAITESEGPIELHIEQQGRTTLASLVPDRNALSRTDTVMGRVEVQGRRLVSLLQEHEVERVDLLQIDTEGYDYQVLSQMDFDRFRPQVIHMEFYCLPIEERIAAFELLAQHNYVYRFLERDLIAVDAEAAGRVFGALGPGH